MALFKRRSAASGTTDSVSGLPELAASHGWQPMGQDALRKRFSQVHELSWILYGRKYSSMVDLQGADPHPTVWEDGYGGPLGDRRVIVANAWTYIGPQDIVKLHELMGVAVCAVELPALCPIMLARPQQLPNFGHLPGHPTGNADFDARIALTLAPFLSPDVMTPEAMQRMAAHDDWVFFAEDYWLVCASRGPFRSADDVTARIDEMLALIAAFPESMMPKTVDRSADDLAARIKNLDTIEDGIAFLQSLTPDDRQRLAKSDTPLALFWDVTTPEQAMQRFETLDVPTRLQLLAMFERVDEA